MVPYQITVPGVGYRLDEDAFETRDLEDYVSECYVSQAGDRLLFSYIYGTQRRKDTRFFASKELEKTGDPAALGNSICPQTNGPSHLFWVDQNTDALLMVTGGGGGGRLVTLWRVWPFTNLKNLKKLFYVTNHPFVRLIDRDTSGRGDF